MTAFLHWHNPIRRGIFIQVGHRKNNLPPESFDCRAVGELSVCECGKRFVFIEKFNKMVELEPSPDLDQYDRAGTN